MAYNGGQALPDSQAEPDLHELRRLPNSGKHLCITMRAPAWERAQFIAQNDPTAKGFSDKNLWRMKQLYETYRDDEKLSPLVRELP